MCHTYSTSATFSVSHELKRYLNFLFHSVRIHAQAHTELLWKVTSQLLVPIPCEGEAGRVDHC